MEEQYFSWVGWDDVDEGVYSFYQCEFTSDLGKYKIGDKVDSILMNFQYGEMHVWDNDEEVESTTKFKLSLNAVEVDYFPNRESEDSSFETVDYTKFMDQNG